MYIQWLSYHSYNTHPHKGTNNPKICTRTRTRIVNNFIRLINLPHLISFDLIYYTYYNSIR